MEDGVAPHGREARFTDHEFQLLEGQALGGTGTGHMADVLFHHGAVQVVGAVPEGRLGQLGAHHDPVGLDVGDVVQHQARDGHGAQLVETALLNIINHQTIIATKASRVALAAKGDKVPGAGTAEAAAKAGVAAIVAANAEEAAEKAAHIVGLLPANNLTGPAIFEFEQPTSVLSAGAAPEKAAAALIDKDSAVELYAGFGKHVYTAFATIGGNAVGIVATGETLCHNCVAKASRFVRLCDAFSVPVLTIVNTNGFAPSVTDDIAGGIREAARLAATYADATTAKVALLSGKAVGPVYTALANADLKIAVNGCTVSALEPNAAVSVLYKAEIDASDNIIAATNAKAAQYTAEVCSAANAVAAGAADMTCDAANARASVVAAFELLSTKRAARLPKKHGNMAL